MELQSLKGDERTGYALRALYRQYGYTRFKMSKFEEYDLYVRNKDFLASDRMITFTDHRGTLLALKPDVTISIIKNTQEGDNGVRKVYYQENVYRTAKGDDTLRELLQTGLECIGALDCYHIFEVIALAVRSLATISPDYVLDLSHMGLLTGLMAAAGVAETDYSQVLSAVREKNADALRQYCRQAGLTEPERALLETLVNTYGDMNTVLEKLAPLCTDEKTGAAWQELDTIRNLLAGCGLAQRVRIDFSVVNDMNYYNGIVFQGFVKGLAAGVLSGGQYDNLVRRMGKDFGAIGFAIYLDQLERLDPPPAAYDADVALWYDDYTDLGQLTRRTGELTAQGKVVLARREVSGLRYEMLEDLRGGDGK